jgi:hypothetical protein
MAVLALVMGAGEGRCEGGKSGEVEEMDHPAAAAAALW